MKSYEKYAIADLHLHLDGSLSSEAIIEVAKDENIKLPTYDPKELRKYLEVPEDCPSLNEYLKRFDIPGLVLQTKNGLRKCTLDLLKRLSNDGLKYAEIRMAPQLSTNKGLSQEDVVKTLIETSKEAKDLYGIKSNFILCMMRIPENKKQNEETIELTKKYLNKGVVAIDLAGAEAIFPNEMFSDLFNKINKEHLPLTIHSGEASGAESVKSALTFSPNRIGHGVHSIESEEVMDMLSKKRIPLEICPKSNLDTKAIKSFKDLPVKEFLKRNIIVTINTDDMSVSNTTLKNEYRILSEEVGLSDAELRQIAINTINSAFISDKEKDELLAFIK